ncbi:hypothetical protein LR48_Vigan1529s000600 [Vigna angularis]|uniref:Uncharacterized protein n=1 Tax=Phaseolus angularis TaxID=3914 RepID=A0A0L9TII8_PHAAN|nr:hypothetical protein LR48_Vigan1529s000600 [Vigna angularis]
MGDLRIWTVPSSDGQPRRFREPLLSHAPPRSASFRPVPHCRRPPSEFRPMTSRSEVSPRATANPVGVKTRLLSTRLYTPPSFSQSRVRIYHAPPSRRRSSQFQPLSSGSGPSLQARPNPSGRRLSLVRTVCRCLHRLSLSDTVLPLSDGVCCCLGTVCRCRCPSVVCFQPV